MIAFNSSKDYFLILQLLALILQKLSSSNCQVYSYSSCSILNQYYNIFTSKTINIQLMRQILFLLVNVLIAVALIYQLYDSKQEYSIMPENIQCLNPSQSQKIACAQCIQRLPNMDQNKGFLIDHNSDYLILEIQKKQNFLTCKQFLHFVNYSDTISINLEMDKKQSITEFIQQLQGKIVNATEKVHIVQPIYKQFIIYRWLLPNQSKNMNVRYPNQQYISYLHHSFLYLLNAIVLIVITAFLINCITRLSRLIKCLLFALFINLEFITFNMGYNQFHISMCYSLLVAASLKKLEVKNTILIIYFVSGLSLIFYPIFKPLYAFGGLFLIITKGYRQVHIKQIWVYLILSHLLLFLNSLVQFYFYNYIADAKCQIVELSILILTPTGFLILSDHKVFNPKEYIQTDPERRFISLNGFDEQEELEEN